jgi:hypothetical protein
MDLHFALLFVVTRSFRGYQKIDLVTLVFDLHIKNFNLGNIYLFVLSCTSLAAVTITGDSAANYA